MKKLIVSLAIGVTAIAQAGLFDIKINTRGNESNKRSKRSSWQLVDRQAFEEKAEAERKVAEAERKAAEEKAAAERKLAEEKAEAERKEAEERAAAERKAAEEKLVAERAAFEKLLPAKIAEYEKKFHFRMRTRVPDLEKKLKTFVVIKYQKQGLNDKQIAEGLRELDLQLAQMPTGADVDQQRMALRSLCNMFHPLADDDM